VEKHIKQAGKSGQETGAADPCRVFLVEDDIDDQQFSKRELESSPLVQEVKIFSNGEDLITYMRTQGFQDHTVMCMTPTIIVVDLNMPKMDGFKILEMLKSDLFLEEIPVVVVSGELSYETIRRALDLRADGIFRKPMSVEKIQSFFSRGWQWPTREMWMS
jgi:CheY-like chemotaxis protein